MKNKNFKIILILLIIIFLFSFIYPFFSEYKYDEQISGLKNHTPSLVHIFGTDYLGRDLFVRVIYGIRITMLISIFSIIISLIIGVPYGMISGYYGKKVELVMSGLIDVIESIPQVLYAIILMTIFSRITSYTKVFRNFDGSLMGVFVTLSLTFWIPISRIIKSETKKIKNKEYVIYAKNKGANFTHIMFKHVFPNCLQTIVIIVIQNIPNSIFIETFLSFIGIGIQPPKPSIGKLINYGVSGMRTYPYALFIPAMALIIIIYLFNLLGREYIKTVENEWINIG